MSNKAVFLFTSYGVGSTTDAALKLDLAKKMLTLIAMTEPLPAQICFYTDGVRLCVKGSPVLDELRGLALKGVELVLCSTCLESFGLREEVQVGIVGGMPDIVEALSRAGKVVTV